MQLARFSASALFFGVAGGMGESSHWGMALCLAGIGFTFALDGLAYAIKETRQNI